MNGTLSGKRIVLYALIAIVSALLGIALGLGPDLVDAQDSRGALYQRIQGTRKPDVPLNAQSTPEEVRALMLHSHNQWQTVQGQAVVRSNNADEAGIEFAFEDYGKGYVATGLNGQPPMEFWLSDGASTQWVDLMQQVRYNAPIPTDSISLEVAGGPASDDQGGESVVYLHPIGSLVNSQIGDRIFPHGISQALETWEVQVIGEEQVAERLVIAISASAYYSTGALAKYHLFWVDAETGLILKSEIYTEEDGFQAWVEQIIITEVKYNDPVPASTFSVEQFQDLESVPLETFLQEPAQSPTEEK